MNMKIENEWLDSEINALASEKHRKRKKKGTDNVLVFKLVLMLSAVFFCVPSIEARSCKIISVKKSTKIMGEGRNFICPKCRTCQWQDNKNADWAGNFHCSVCGYNLGK